MLTANTPESDLGKSSIVNDIFTQLLTRRLYFLRAYTSLPWGSAWTVLPLIPVIVSAATMAFTIASSVVWTTPRKSPVISGCARTCTRRSELRPHFGYSYSTIPTRLKGSEAHLEHPLYGSPGPLGYFVGHPHHGLLLPQSPERVFQVYTLHGGALRVLLRW